MIIIMIIIIIVSSKETMFSYKMTIVMVNNYIAYVINSTLIKCLIVLLIKVCSYIDQQHNKPINSSVVWALHGMDLTNIHTALHCVSIFSYINGP